MADVRVIAGRNAYDATISPEKWQSQFLTESFLRNIWLPLMGSSTGNIANSNGFITVLTNWRGDQSNVELSIPMSSEIDDRAHQQITDITGTETGVLTTAQKIKWTYFHRALGRDRITHISDLFDLDREAVRLLMNYWDRQMSRMVVATLYSPILTGVFGRTNSTSGVNADERDFTPFVNDPAASEDQADFTSNKYLQRNVDRILVANGTDLVSTNTWATVKTDLTTGATAKADHKLTMNAIRKMRRRLEDRNSPSIVNPTMLGTLMRQPRYRVIMSRDNSDVLEDELQKVGIMNYGNRGSAAMFAGEAFDWKGFSFYSNPYLYPIATSKTDHATAANRVMDLVFVGGDNAMMLAFKIAPTIQREVQQYGNVVGWNLLAAGGSKLVGLPGSVATAHYANMGIIATRAQ